MRIKYTSPKELLHVSRDIQDATFLHYHHGEYKESAIAALDQAERACKELLRLISIKRREVKKNA